MHIWTIIKLAFTVFPQSNSLGGEFTYVPSHTRDFYHSNPQLKFPSLFSRLRLQLTLRLQSSRQAAKRENLLKLRAILILTATRYQTHKDP